LAEAQRDRSRTARPFDIQHACKLRLERVKQFLAHKPDDKNTIYALHAPEVECIAKSLP
jgi:hypothetical protein